MMAGWIIVLVLAWINGLMGGWCAHDAWQDRQAKRPKTLDQLAREQGIKPVRSIDDLVPESARLDDDEWEAWTAAMREARGHD